MKDIKKKHDKRNSSTQGQRFSRISQVKVSPSGKVEHSHVFLVIAINQRQKLKRTCQDLINQFRSVTRRCRNLGVVFACRLNLVKTHHIISSDLFLPDEEHCYDSTQQDPTVCTKLHPLIDIRLLNLPVFSSRSTSYYTDYHQKLKGSILTRVPILPPSLGNLDKPINQPSNKQMERKT